LEQLARDSVRDAGKNGASGIYDMSDALIKKCGRFPLLQFFNNDLCQDLFGWSLTCISYNRWNSNANGSGSSVFDNLGSFRPDFHPSALVLSHLPLDSGGLVSALTQLAVENPSRPEGGTSDKGSQNYSRYISPLGLFAVTLWVVGFWVLWHGLYFLDKYFRRGGLLTILRYSTDFCRRVCIAPLFRHAASPTLAARSLYSIFGEPD
jgi:hypothetical protein